VVLLHARTGDEQAKGPGERFRDKMGKEGCCEKTGIPQGRQSKNNRREALKMASIGLLGEFTPLSKPFNTKALAEKARLKYPERQRKSVGLGVIRITN
jgi:hypothetical protein